MVRGQNICELMWKVRGDCRVAIGDMGDEIDEVAERDNAGIRRRRWCLQKDVSLRLVLAVLFRKLLFVRTDCSSAEVGHADHCQMYAGSRRILYCRLDL